MMNSAQKRMGVKMWNKEKNTNQSIKTHKNTSTHCRGVPQHASTPTYPLQGAHGSLVRIGAPA